jgi:hypothetical protein
MARAGSGARKKVWKKVVVGLLVGVAAIGALLYWKRYDIALKYLEGNQGAQEAVILQMLDLARPIIEKNIKMSLPQKIFSTLAGKRSQKERQSGALQDVRKFSELSFRNHWLAFKDVHRLDTLHGFNLRGFDFALEWIHGNAGEVLEAFSVRFLKREVGKSQINESCGFFTALKSYVETNAQKN